MKKLISKDKDQIRYLLDNGLTEVTYLNQKLKVVNLGLLPMHPIGIHMSYVMS